MYNFASMFRTLNFYLKKIIDRFKLSAKKTKKNSLNFKIHSKKTYRKVSLLINKKPLTSVFILLFILFLLIILSNIIRKPKEEVKSSPPEKKVPVYHIGEAPKLTFSAQVDKSGVIQISSLASGVVQKIYVKEGDNVNRGNWLVSLSTNYQGGNALTLTRQLAEKQNQIVKENYPSQKDLIVKQRDLAQASHDNFTQMKDIIAKSVDDTQNLINLNNDIISTLDTNLLELEASSSANSSLILSTKQMKSQFQSANLQLNSALRNANYQIDSNNPPSILADLQKDIALKNLDIQEKALDLNKEISALQLQLAQVNEALMFPSAPIPATVQKVFVRVGQPVSPGTPLFTLSGNNNTHLTATIYISSEIANRISKLTPTEFNINGKAVRLYPTFISDEAVSGNLYSVVYNLPDDDYGNLTDKGYINAEVPIGYADTSSAVPYLPLDSIYQTQSEAFIFVEDHGQAVAKKVELGSVFGRFVQVNKGVNSGDTVILDRNIVAGDRIEEN